MPVIKISPYFCPHCSCEDCKKVLLLWQEMREKQIQKPQKRKKKKKK